jgi:hypothetical protein
MLSSGDDSDLAEADAISQAPRLGSAGRCTELASSNLSLQRIVREPPRWRNPQTRLIGGRPAHFRERELRALMTAGLDGDAAAYHQLLGRLTSHLRAYYRQRFARIGHGPARQLLRGRYRRR